MRTPLAGFVALTLSGLLACGGCQRAVLPESETESCARVETSTVRLGGATRVAAVIRMGAGELKVSAAPSRAAVLDAKFAFAPSAWRPEVTYRTSDGLGVLEVCQPECDGRPLGEERNTWDLKLAVGVPTNLLLTLDAGTSTVDLRNVDVRDLEIAMGFGGAKIDLSGPRTTNVNGTIETGAGEATVFLPSDIGVRVTGADTGPGDLLADGFTLDGGDYVNAAWAKAGPKMLIRLKRGVGDVRLVPIDR